MDAMSCLVAFLVSVANSKDKESVVNHISYG